MQLSNTEVLFKQNVKLLHDYTLSPDSNISWDSQTSIKTTSDGVGKRDTEFNILDILRII